MNSTRFKGHHKINPVAALAKARKITGGVVVDEAQVRRASPLPICDAQTDQLAQFVEALYGADDNIWLQAATNRGPIGDRLVAPAKTLASSAGEICATYKTWGVLTCTNPVKDKIGSGKNGRHRDSDIAKYEYVLVEHDLLPLGEQLALLTKLPLPLVSLVHSGGKSIHALVRVGANSEEHFRTLVGDQFLWLGKLGFDLSNCNPSRLTRTPGVYRVTESRTATGSRLIDGIQRLIYLNPNADCTPIAEQF